MRFWRISYSCKVTCDRCIIMRIIKWIESLIFSLLIIYVNFYTYGTLGVTNIWRVLHKVGSFLVESLLLSAIHPGVPDSLLTHSKRIRSIHKCGCILQIDVHSTDHSKWYHLHVFRWMIMRYHLFLIRPYIIILESYCGRGANTSLLNFNECPLNLLMHHH